MGVAIFWVWLIVIMHTLLGDADTAVPTATEDGEGGWKTEPLPWEDSDRDYTYEEVFLISFTIVLLIIALH